MTGKVRVKPLADKFALVEAALMEHWLFERVADDPTVAADHAVPASLSK